MRYPSQRREHLYPIPQTQSRTSYKMAQHGILRDSYILCRKTRQGHMKGNTLWNIFGNTQDPETWGALLKKLGNSSFDRGPRRNNTLQAESQDQGTDRFHYPFHMPT